MPSRPQLASRLDFAALAALAVCFPGLAVLLPLSVVPVTLAAGLLALVAEVLSGERLSRPGLAVGASALWLALWALLSALWALDPAHSLETWARLLPTVAAGGFLVLHAGRQPAEQRRRIAGWLLAGFAVAVALLAFEGASGRAINLLFAQLVDRVPDGGGFPLNRMNRGAVAVAILVWPAAAALAARLPVTRRPAVLLLPLATIPLLWFFASASAFLACAVALVAALLCLPAPRLARGILLALVAVLLLAMPQIAKEISSRGLAEEESLAFSFRHRVFIWNFAAEAIDERPLIGWGLDASRDLAKPGSPRFDGTHGALPLHPHNAALQVRLELGWVGLLLGGLLLLLVLSGIRRGPPLATALDAGLACSILVVGLLAFGVWQLHWLVVPLVAAALMRLTAVPGTTVPGASQSSSES
ncbi:MAG: O-antigen ligase family protein [Tistlia sp.]|uniref:O-antigen ligase family protein n=1 Tax=Tistlia sp. TaxID=3057121 RepID=UPI0034A50E8B